MLQAYSDMNLDRFADACFDMDNAVRFTFWELTMLRRIKRGLQVRERGSLVLVMLSAALYVPTSTFTRSWTLGMIRRVTVMRKSSLMANVRAQSRGVARSL